MSGVQIPPPLPKKMKKNSKKRSVIFGGSGFIGSHVADTLSDIGHEVIIFDKKKSKYLKKNQKMIVSSLNNLKKIDEVLDKANFVFHFAGVADINEANQYPLKAVKDNVLGTLNILNFSIKRKIERFIFASSIYVFSEQGGFYRTTKQSCELLIENFSNFYNLKYTNVRYGSLYGERANHFNLINNSINDALKGKNIVKDGNGSEIRNYINVKDAALATSRLLNKKYINKNVNIFGNKSFKVKTVMSIIKNNTNSKVKIKFTGVKDNSHYRLTPFTFKPRKSILFPNKKQIDLEEGIKKIIKSKK